MVEGSAAGRDDGADDGIEIVEHIGSGDTQSPKPHFAQYGVTSRIMLGSVTAIMRFAIQLDGKPRGEAGEI